MRRSERVQTHASKPSAFGDVPSAPAIGKAVSSSKALHTAGFPAALRRRVAGFAFAAGCEFPPRLLNTFAAVGALRRREAGGVSPQDASSPRPLNALELGERETDSPGGFAARQPLAGDPQAAVARGSSRSPNSVNKLAVALAVRDAMREHRKGKPIAFQQRTRL